MTYRHTDFTRYTIRIGNFVSKHYVEQELSGTWSDNNEKNMDKVLRILLAPISCHKNCNFFAKSLVYAISMLFPVNHYVKNYQEFGPTIIKKHKCEYNFRMVFVICMEIRYQSALV